VLIYGVDFSSAPTAKRPMVCAVCRLEGDRLTVSALEAGITSLGAFEGLLRRPGPWHAGLDFPFGLPDEVVQALGWPGEWAGYVRAAAGLSASEFADLVSRFLESRPLGRRHAYRQTDRIARALAPTNVRGVPTARMFHCGAPLLLDAGVSVIPCLPRACDRVVVEAYPRLVIRSLAGEHVQYKAARGPEGRRRAAEARRAILDAILAGRLRSKYGISLEANPDVLEKCAEDHTGDTLDAVLCAVQAGWSARQSLPLHGVPANCNRNEGWIADPAALGPA